MNGLTTIDYLLLAAYAAAVLAIGFWRYRSAPSRREFYLGGGKLGWLPLGLSLMVSLASSLGFLAVPTAGQRAGALMLWSLVAFPVCFPIVVWMIVPFFRRLDLFSAYEYLERRFALRVRLLASGLFIAWRITWMAAVLYVPALAIHAASGGSLPVLPVVLVFGTLATLYTAFGGLRAVVWTDVAQFVVMFGGVAAALYAVLQCVPGGFGGVWQAAAHSGKLQLAAAIPGWEGAGLAERARLYLYTDFTAGAIIVSFTIGKLGNFGADQVMIQRYLSARSDRAAQGAFIANCIYFPIFFVVMLVTGLGLAAVRTQGLIPPSVRPDEALPYFVAHFVPSGLAGLLIAGIIAAAMSSFDSGINSSVTAFMSDFYRRLGWGGARGDHSEVFVARLVSLGCGAMALGLALVVGNLGDLFEIALKVVNSFLGPLLALFVLAMFSRRANTFGAFWGGIVGIGLTAILVFAEALHNAAGTETFIGQVAALLDIGFMWVSPLGFAATWAIGYAFSYLRAADPIPRIWTWSAVMAEESDAMPFAVEGGAE
jgi:SSS family transporter